MPASTALNSSSFKCRNAKFNRQPLKLFDGTNYTITVNKDGTGNLRDNDPNNNFRPRYENLATNSSTYCVSDYSVYIHICMFKLANIIFFDTYLRSITSLRLVLIKMAKSLTQSF